MAKCPKTFSQKIFFYIMLISILLIWLQMCKQFDNILAGKSIRKLFFPVWFILSRSWTACISIAHARVLICVYIVANLTRTRSRCWRKWLEKFLSNTWRIWKNSSQSELMLMIRILLWCGPVDAYLIIYANGHKDLTTYEPFVAWDSTSQFTLCL